MWPFKHYLKGSVESVMMTHVALPTRTVRTQGGCLKSYSAIINYLFKRYMTDENIATDHADDAKICAFKQESLMEADDAQQL